MAKSMSDQLFAAKIGVLIWPKIDPATHELEVSFDSHNRLWITLWHLDRKRKRTGWSGSLLEAPPKRLGNNKMLSDKQYKLVIKLAST